MGNLILYYISCKHAGLLKINGNIAGNTKETLCALSPKTSEVFLEWQSFDGRFLPLCICLEFKDGELKKNPIADTAKVLIYSKKLMEIILEPRQNRLLSLPPHGHFDLPYTKNGKEYVLRGYHDGGDIISIENILDLNIEYIAYTGMNLKNCRKGIFENGSQTLLYISDSENVMLISHADKAELTGVYRGGVEVSESALTITEELPYFAARKRRITFTQGKFFAEFSQFERNAFKSDEDTAMSLMFCVKYGLLSDAEKILSYDLPKGTAARLPEFFGEFDRFMIPHISSKCENGTVCVALLKDMCQNVSMAKLFFFKIKEGTVINISD